MSNGFEDELGLGPVMHRMRLWLRNLFTRVGMSASPQDRRTLDPLTVNYEAWREVRRNVREWPQYREAPNTIDVLVSPEDWDDYWGIDLERKEDAISTYVAVRAAKKRYWMVGDPQVHVYVDDTLEVGEVGVSCSFQEPLDTDGESGPWGTASMEPVPEERPAKPSDHTRVMAPRSQPSSAEEEQDAPDTLRLANAATERACLVGEGGFRLVLESGDCIGAVSSEDDVPEEVNVRLDADGFPYVEAKQFSIGIVDGRWSIVNHASCGTKLLTTAGSRLMLGEPIAYPLEEGDVVYLGPSKPLRFEVEHV